ncbi:MAG: hypothetical protein CBC09_05030 [Cellvibrionales bacterium TMED49]|nr:efflux transporter periplasmic adaptor subunit [Porticoccaceae bacterium]OUU38643.1 MAG: hypothetical protein CBC09_05030 [Cellvibrionales bacterium TMED49]
MAKSSQKIIVTVSVVFAGALLISATYFFKPTQERVSQQSPQAIEVTVVKVQPKTHQLNVVSQGTISPKYEIDLIAEVAGRIEFVAPNFANGDFFNAGEKLVQIEPIDYQLSLITAKSAVARAEEQLAIERGRVRQARREWRELGDEEANELFLRKPQLKASEAALASASAECNRAQIQLDRTTITAPFNGRIRNTFVHSGQFVSRGTRLATIFSSEVAEIRLPLRDQQLQWLDLPSASSSLNRQKFPVVSIKSTIGAVQHTREGRIVRTESSIDPQSRMTFAVAEITEPFSETNVTPLDIGRFVEAKIAGVILDDVTVLPRHAIYKNDLVLTVTDENSIEFTRVDVIKTSPEQAIVRGISEGTVVVFSRVANPYAGMSVSTSPPKPTGKVQSESTAGELL